jgi:hypothetical protein
MFANHADGLMDIIETRDQLPFCVRQGEVTWDMYRLTSLIIRTFQLERLTLLIDSYAPSWHTATVPGTGTSKYVLYPLVS